MASASMRGHNKHCGMWGLAAIMCASWCQRLEVQDHGHMQLFSGTSLHGLSLGRARREVGVPISLFLEG